MTTDQKARAEAVGLPSGARVGKYEIVERLGRGGQAIVYKGYDAMLDRHVAIKHIPAQLAADPKFVERFTREAQILARLGSEEPAIVTIHDVVEEQRGLFIVMEYLGGHSLETVIENTRGPSEVKATLQVLWRLAAGLHAVHSAGIIHRDLKPGNIIICEGLRVKITDFGVAASLTGQTSMVLGTTKYMAPELFEGGRKVDGRADMYSLGFIAYEMLAGRPKFDEIFADVVRDRHSEALRWMKWHGNAGVSAPPLAEVNPVVPRGLSDIVARMMAKDPDERFESMEALGRAIRSSFSPRAKAAAPPARLRQVRPAAAAVLAAGEAEAASLDERDEGDELEVAPAAAAETGGPATAPLPKGKLGRKLLLYVAIPLAGLLLAGTVVGLILNARAEARRRWEFERSAAGRYQKADGQFVHGLKFYDRASFAAARDGFQTVAKQFRDSNEGQKAFVRASLCEAYLGTADQKWEEATARMAEAEDRCNAVQRDRGDLTNWVQSVRGEIKNFKAYYILTRTFREAMAKARQLLAARQFDDARQSLRDDLRGVVLIAPYEGELKQLADQLDLTELRQQLQVQTAKGDDLLAHVKLVEAEEAYQKAQALLQEPRAQVLPAAERNAAAAALRDKLAKLMSDRTRQEAEGALAEARKGGDKQQILEALRNLNRIRPEAAHQEEMTALRSSLAFELGVKLKGEGKLVEARQAFEQSVSLKDNPEARAQLAALDKAQSRADLVGAGDAGFAGGRWEEALAKYEEAGKLDMDDALRNKITECRYRILLTKAQSLRDAGKRAEARPVYLEAKTVKPSAAALIDSILEQMNADERYEARMAAGRDALKRDQWAKAREEFQKAQEVRDTQEVKQAILDARYRENFVRGKEALDQGDFRGALGYLNLAKGFKDTPEVRALIAQAQDKMK